MGHLNKEEYNNEPVFFCKHCLSLRIRSTEDIDYCDTCGSSEIGEASIDDWGELYKLKYNHKYLEENNGNNKGRR